MAAQFIRAEDFDIVEDRMILGGRILEANSILSAHVDKRTSLELLGFYAAILICLGIGVASGSGAGFLGMTLLAGLFALGARREIVKPYVLVMNIYQFGTFEVRGFTADEAESVEIILDDLRRGHSARSGQKSGFMAGSAGW
jgi:hypothetical protein